jgi:hypothetical protein
MFIFKLTLFMERSLKNLEASRNIAIALSTNVPKIFVERVKSYNKSAQ